MTARQGTKEDRQYLALAEERAGGETLMTRRASLAFWLVASCLGWLALYALVTAAAGILF